MYFGFIKGGEMIPDKHHLGSHLLMKASSGVTREAIEQDATHGAGEAIRCGSSRRPHCRSRVVDASVWAPYSLAAACDRPLAWLDRMVVMARGRPAGSSASYHAFSVPLQTWQRAAPQLPVRVGVQKITSVLDGTRRVNQRPGGPE
jgi:hypothetical protein